VDDDLDRSDHEGSTENAALRDALRAEASCVFTDAGYSGAGHLQESLRWAKWDDLLGLYGSAISAVLAAGAGVSAILDSSPWITASAALLSAVLGAAKSFLRPDERADGHGSKGNSYLTLRNQARFFHEIDMHSGQPTEILTERLRDVHDRYNALNESAPHRISEGARRAAKASIDRGDMSYKGDPLWKELER
jgi:hypothetical protein